MSSGSTGTRRARVDKSKPGFRSLRPGHGCVHDRSSRIDVFGAPVRRTGTTEGDKSSRDRPQRPLGSREWNRRNWGAAGGSAAAPRGSWWSRRTPPRARTALGWRVGCRWPTSRTRLRWSRVATFRVTTARSLLRGLLELHAIPGEEFPWDPALGDAFNAREAELERRVGRSAAGWLSAGRPRREAFRVGAAPYRARAASASSTTRSSTRPRRSLLTLARRRPRSRPTTPICSRRSRRPSATCCSPTRSPRSATPTAPAACTRRSAPASPAPAAAPAPAGRSTAAGSPSCSAARRSSSTRRTPPGRPTSTSSCSRRSRSPRRTSRSSARTSRSTRARSSVSSSSPTRTAAPAR